MSLSSRTGNHTGCEDLFQNKTGFTGPDDYAITPAALGLIESRVGGREEFEVVRLIRGDDSSDAYRRFHLYPVGTDGKIGNGASYSFSNDAQIFERAIREDCDEFLTAVSAHKIIGAHCLADAIGSLLQNFITSQMAEGVIHRFEVIQVHHQNPGGSVRPRSSLNLSPEQMQGRSTAPDTGQSVMGRVKSKCLARFD